MREALSRGLLLAEVMERARSGTPSRTGSRSAVYSGTSEGLLGRTAEGLVGAEIEMNSPPRESRSTARAAMACAGVRAGVPSPGPLRALAGTTIRRGSGTTRGDKLRLKKEDGPPAPFATLRSRSLLLCSLPSCDDSAETSERRVLNLSRVGELRSCQGDAATAGASMLGTRATWVGMGTLHWLWGEYGNLELSARGCEGQTTRPAILPARISNGAGQGHPS